MLQKITITLKIKNGVEPEPEPDRLLHLEKRQFSYPSFFSRSESRIKGVRKNNNMG